MKKITKYIVLIALGIAISSFSYAQTSTKATPSTNNTGIRVATVNIYDATNTKINNSKYSVSFRIQNGTGIQSNIRYGIQLVRKSDSRVVDMQLANEAITLTEKESRDITIEYNLPAFVPNDTYKLMIIAENQNGLPLAYMPAGIPERLITINNSNGGISIDNCYLTKEGDASTTAKYTNTQGVLVSGSEKLLAHCTVSSSSLMANNNLRLQLITHKRDQLGDILTNNILDNKVSLKGDDASEITFEIPTLTIPQIYSIDTFLINSSDQKVSTSYYIRYSVAGLSATIQNAILDNVNYKKGGTATLKVFWTSSSGAKDTYILNAKITDANGNICTSAKKNINTSTTIGNETLKLAIEKDCRGAIAEVTITDTKGNILDTTSINPNEKTSSANINAKVPYYGHFIPEFNKTYVILFVVVLALIAYGILVLRKNKDENVK